MVLDELRPFYGLFALVKRLPGDGFADSDAEGLVHILVHLVDQEQHCQIKWQTLVGEIGQTIEEIGVLSAEMDGYDIALILHALGNECLCPGDIADDTVLLAGAETSREHQHVVVTLESCLYHRREVTALIACLIDRNTDRCQTR